MYLSGWCTQGVYIGCTSQDGVYPGWVWEVYPGYTPVGMGGIPWLYTPWHMPGIHSLVYAPLYTPGYAPSSCCTRVYLYPRTPHARCGLREPWAQTMRNVWVRALLASLIPKGVRGVRASLRVITPLSWDERTERLDRRRVTAHISPLVEPCCAKWSSVLPVIRSLWILR